MKHLSWNLLESLTSAVQCSWSQSFENDLHRINRDLSFFPQYFYFKKLMLSHHYITLCILKVAFCAKARLKRFQITHDISKFYLALGVFYFATSMNVTFGDLVKNFFTAALIPANPILYKIHLDLCSWLVAGKCLGPVTWSTLTFWERCTDRKIKPAGFFSL